MGTQLTKKMPDLLNGRQPSYSRTERDGHTFWRVRNVGVRRYGPGRGFCDASEPRAPAARWPISSRVPMRTGR